MYKYIVYLYMLIAIVGYYWLLIDYDTYTI